MREEFNIGLFINGENSKLTPSNYYFTMESSIHKVLPTAQLVLRDPNGIFKESALFIEGQSIWLNITYNGRQVLNKYVVTKQESSGEPPQQGNMDDNLKVNLIHEFQNELSIESKAYDGKISDIIKDIANSYSTFKSINIDTTTTKKIWYKPLQNHIAYIEKYLIPNAYSKASDDTPFYCFINNNNEFYFNHFKTFTDKNVTDDVYITVQPDNRKNTITGVHASSIRFLSTGVELTYRDRHKKSYYIDNQTGELKKDTDYINSYPKNTQNIPLIANKSNITSYEIVYPDNGEQAIKEVNKAIRINKMRNSMFTDRVKLPTRLNLKWKVGEKVFLIAPHYNIEDSSYNAYFNTEWIIEEVQHVWEGKFGNTILILGRKDNTLLRRNGINSRLLR